MTDDLSTISTDDMLDRIRIKHAERQELAKDIDRMEAEIRRRCGHLTPIAPQPVMPLPQPYWPPNTPYRWDEVWCNA